MQSFLLLSHVLVCPAPFRLELSSDEVDTPAGLLLDFGQDRKNLGLLFEVGKALGSNGQSANGDTGDAPVLNVCYNTTDLLGMIHLQAVHLGRLDGKVGVHLR